MALKDVMNAMRSLGAGIGAGFRKLAGPAIEVDPDADAAIQRALDACTADQGRWTVDPDAPAVQTILDSTGPERGRRVLALVARLTGRVPTRDAAILQSLADRLLRRPLPIEADDLERLVQVAVFAGHVPRSGTILTAVEEHVLQEGALTVSMRDALQNWSRLDDSTRTMRRVGVLLDRSMGGQTFALTPTDPWGTAVHSWWTSLDDDQEAWTQLFDHATSASGARPSRAWIDAAVPLVQAVGASAFTKQLSGWLDSVATALPWNGVGSHEDVLKGLIWCAAAIPAPEADAVALALGRFGERAYRKVRGVGAASTKLGNAVVATLGAMPDGSGVPQLTRLRTSVRYASARKLIERALDEVCDGSDLSRDDVEEVAIPHFGLDADGVKSVAVGADGFEAVLSLEGGRASLRWSTPAGKLRKTAPKALKASAPESIKAMKTELRELAKVADGQARRIEQHYVTGRVLPLEQLRSRYLDHPLVGQTARRLLWWVEPADRPAQAVLWRDGGLTDLGGERVVLADDTPCRLWHPMLGDATRQLIWRDHLADLGIDQPFSQVWREVYEATEPSGPNGTDARFAGVLLDQRRLVDHAQRLGWRYQVQGYFDSANDPSKGLGDIGVMLETDPVQHSSDDAVHRYVVSGVCSFWADERPVDASDVPPLLLSEALRATDVLVQRSMAGKNPPTTGFPRGFDWEALAFGPLTPLGETRREVLKTVLPRTTLSSKCTLRNRWLDVTNPDGVVARVHLGTAMMLVEGQPMASKPDRSALQHAKAAFLPFEGDPALPRILALAFSWAAG